MTIKARWHQEIVVPDDDPFRQRVEEVGFPITLTDEIPKLETQLLDLIRSEGAMHDAGLTCAIKDRDDTSCSACPISAHNDESSAMRPLCLCGREQEKVMTQLAVAREASRGDR